MTYNTHVMQLRAYAEQVAAKDKEIAELKTAVEEADQRTQNVEDFNDVHTARIDELQTLLKSVCHHDSWSYEHGTRICADCGDDIGKDDS